MLKHYRLLIIAFFLRKQSFGDDNVFKQILYALDAFRRQPFRYNSTTFNWIKKMLIYTQLQKDGCICFIKFLYSVSK